MHSEAFQQVEFDAATINRFDRSGPRYTSYPTADRFHPGFDAATYAAWAMQRRAVPAPGALSLYVHLPFCNTICFYCGCNKVITKDRGRSGKYVEYVAREAGMHAALLAPNLRVEQLHWGGGTPTFLAHDQMRSLMGALRSRFDFAPTGEYSIEVDPRKVDAPTVDLLGELGFNRMSVGIQDFDPAVQKAVNRIQSEAETRAVMERARQAGFGSISVDLIYGLPFQTLDGFAATLDKVIDADPDRISIYNYAHLPALFKPQRRINEADLPRPEVKLDLLSLAIRKLSSAGYLYIGMDHFAKPEDELSRAQRSGRLQRNFQGYSTHADCDMVSLGITAIGKMGPTYSQNVRTLEEYYAHLDRGELPILRGIELSRDDLARGAVIQSLMCQFSLDMAQLDRAWGWVFEEYFAPEMVELARLRDNGLVTIEDRRVEVTPRGRLLVRSICMVFDHYLRQAQQAGRYSKVI